LGPREQEENTVSVRTRDGKDLSSMPVNNFIQILKEEIKLLGSVKSEE